MDKNSKTYNRLHEVARALEAAKARHVILLCETQGGNGNSESMATSAKVENGGADHVEREVGRSDAYPGNCRALQVADKMRCTGTVLLPGFRQPLTFWKNDSRFSMESRQKSTARSLLSRMQTCSRCSANADVGPGTS